MSVLRDGAVTVSVPATSANLGPGFDALGLALEHRDRVRARVLDRPEVRIAVTGEGETTVPLDERHLVWRSMRAAFELMGVEAPGVALECENAVPHARGLGSSSAAIVAGVCAARGLVADGASLLGDEDALDLAARLEGHPDNVAPALLGGFTVAWHDPDRFRAVSVRVDPRLQAVVLVPPDGVETSLARGLLPEVVTHGDAAANAGRTALLVTALCGRLDLLLAATEDRLHQDYREQAMPDTLALVRSLRADGLAAVVSGAGPTVLVLTDADGRQAVTERAPEGWRALAVPVDRTGAVVSVEAPRAG